MQYNAAEFYFGSPLVTNIHLIKNKLFSDNSDIVGV